MEPSGASSRYACYDSWWIPGEAGYISVLLGFIIGMIGWAVIIWEIFRGEASQAATTKESVTSAFNAMRLIVLVGWAIYPLGYVWSNDWFS